MGYRSTGLWVIKGPVNDIIAAWTACRLIKTPPKPADWGCFKVFHVDGIGYIRLEYPDWKWHQDYPDIQFFESVWDNLDAFKEAQEEPTISGKRIRVGEDDDDTEIETFGDDPPDIYISRSISDHEPSTGELFSKPS